MDQRRILQKFLDEVQNKKTIREEFASEFLVSPLRGPLRGAAGTFTDLGGPTFRDQIALEIQRVSDRSGEERKEAT